MDKAKKLGLIAVLQAAVLLYTLSSVTAKLAAGRPFASPAFFALYGAELLLLAVYAVVWQQILKRAPVSMAYANRAVGIVWSMIAAALVFHETVTVKNLVGVAVVLCGTLLVNSDE